MRHSTAAACLGLCLTASGGCGDAVDRRPATWGYISAAITQPSCATASCHSAAAAAAGLDFSDPDRGYKSLTGLSVLIPDPDMTQVMKFRPMVVPYNPDQSRVVHMLRAQNAARMPPDRPLSEADIALVERWILNGAKKVPDNVRPPALDGGGPDGARDDTRLNAGEGGAADLPAAESAGVDTAGGG